MFHRNNKKKIIIEGMMCEHCAKKVETVLMNIENVEKVKVNLKEKSATIFYIGTVSLEEITSAITELEYKVISIENI